MFSRLFSLGRAPQPSPDREDYDAAIELMLCGLGEAPRDVAKNLVDLDGLFQATQKDGVPPVEAAVYATRLILGALINGMSPGQRERHLRAIHGRDIRDGFCKLMHCMAEITDQFIEQGRVNPKLVRSLFDYVLDRLQGLSEERAVAAWTRRNLAFPPSE